jgi:cyanophycin synthetase
VYFSHDPAHPTFAEHVDRGGRGVYESGGLLMWADGGHQLRLASSRELPFTLQGKARHNVSNAMAVLAALISLQIPPERVVAGLSSFTSSESQNPLRLNVYQTEGVTLLVDYAHNAAAYRAIAQTGRAMTSGRLIGVVAAPGNRRDDDLIEIGRVCGGGFDAVVVYEMDDKRGRPAGATAAFVARGVSEARHGAQAEDGSEAVPIVLDVRAAIRAAVQRSRPGDFVIIGCASHLSDLKAALGADALLTSLDAGGPSPVDVAAAASRPDPAARAAPRTASAS